MNLGAVTVADVYRQIGKNSPIGENGQEPESPGSCRSGCSGCSGCSDRDLPRGITRYEYDRTRGYLVRIHRTEEGIRTCKARRLFSDGVYGSRGEAKRAAVEFHAQMQGPREKKRTGGYGYVRYSRESWKTATEEVRNYFAWRAWFWDDEGRPSSSKWSVDQHGSDEARRKAEDWLARKQAGEPGVELAEVG